MRSDLEELISSELPISIQMFLDMYLRNSGVNTGGIGSGSALERSVVIESRIWELEGEDGKPY